MGGAGRFFKISLKQRKPRPEMSLLVVHVDKKKKLSRVVNNVGI